MTNGQKQKLLALAQIFLENTDETHALTAPQLLAALGARGLFCERKSLYDDIEALKSAGMDIVCRKGPGGGYFLASRLFELAELKLLVDAVQCSRFITPKKAARLIRKLERLTSIHQAGKLDRQVVLEGRIKAKSESMLYTVDLIHEAIAQRQAVRFHYWEWALDAGRPTRRRRRGGAAYTVAPWALTWSEENYYLIGFDVDAGEVRHFRVDKIESLGPAPHSGAGEEQRKTFQPASYTGTIFGMFGGELQTVKLRFANRLAGVVLDRFGGSVALLEDGSTHFTVEVRATVSPLFLAWISGFGGEAEVLRPETVRSALIAQANSVLAVYAAPHIRPAVPTDLPRILAILDEARTWFKMNGIDQWQNGYPTPGVIEADIAAGESWVAEQNGLVTATAAFCFGGEPSYDVICEGAWQTPGPYAALHRIAAATEAQGTGAATALLQALERMARARRATAIRVDTQRDNNRMLNFLNKHGFCYCGIIHLADGAERLAFDKALV